jgi:hypothetical protein
MSKNGNTIGYCSESLAKVRIADMRHAAPRFIILQHLRHCRVDAEELAVRRGAEYANWSVFEKVTVPFFRLPKGIIRFPNVIHFFRCRMTMLPEQAPKCVKTLPIVINNQYLFQV